MANALYALGRESFLRGEISWNTNDIKLALVDTDLYTPDLNTDQFLDDIPGGAIVATSGNFANKTTTAGVADADNVVLGTVSGAQCEALVIYQDTGVPGTSRLIAYIDTATGLPATPSGGDITIEWSAGADRIFRL